MSTYASIINKNGITVSVSTPVRKFLKLKCQNIAPKYIQHTNRITNLETNEHHIMENDVTLIAEYVNNLK